MTEHLISAADAKADLLMCAAYLAEAIRSREGHSDAMLQIIPRFLKNNNVDLAAELANTIDDPFGRDRVLIKVAERCAVIEDDEYALQLTDAIEDHGLQLQARERIAEANAAGGRFERALEIADQLPHPDSVFAAIAIKKASNGDDAAALAMIEKIEYPGAKVHALAGIALERSASDGKASAAEFGRLASESSDDIEHSEEQIRAQLDLGNILIDAERNDLAVETFEKARINAEQLDNVHRDAFLASSALGFLRAGSLELADRTLDSVSDKTQLSSALLGFSREFSRRDEQDEATEALNESYEILRSQRESETRDTRSRQALFGSIAMQYAGYGNGELAISIANEILDEGEQTKALGQVARILTQKGMDEQAGHAIEAIRDDASRTIALIFSSDAAEEFGDRPKALTMLEQAELLAEEVPQLASRSSAYIAVADRFVRYEDKEKARHSAIKGLETIAAIRDEASQAAALANLSELYASAKLELLTNELEIVADMIRRADMRQ